MDNFKIQSKDLWLQLLDVTETELERTINNKEESYHVYQKKKLNGHRTIYCINDLSELYILQNKLQKLFFSNIFLPECVYGFRSGYSYIDFLIPHTSIKNNINYLRLDIKDFFESISIELVKNFFKYYIDDSVQNDDANYIIDSIIGLTTFNNKFVQGAVTSPAISNFIFRQIDIRISIYCKKLNICYTRYADDMLFSSTNKYIHSKHFIIAIKSILNDYGFLLNNSKTLRFKNEISLNGYVIGKDIRLSRKKLYKINKLIFELSKSDFGGFINRTVEYRIKNKLAGYRSLFIQVYRYSCDANYKNYLNNKIKIIEQLIDKYYSK